MIRRIHGRLARASAIATVWLLAGPAYAAPLGASTQP